MAGKFVLFPQGDDPDWSKLYQVLGVFNGLTKWQRLLNATGVTDDSNFLLRLRNRGSGGKHQRWEKSTDGSTVATMTDTGLAMGTGTGITLGSINPFAAGRVELYAGSSIPAGWLICDGGVYSQTTYATLYAAIGATWNTGGEGAGNFRVPDLRQRFVLGVDGGFALGATGGSATANLQHSHSGPTHDHTAADHSHGPGTLANSSHGHGAGTYAVSVSSTTQVNDKTVGRSSGGSDTAGDGHDHDFSVNTSVTGSSSNQNANIDQGQTADKTGFVTNGFTGGGAGTTGNGGSTTQSVRNPYAALYYIIYAAA